MQAASLLYCALASDVVCLVVPLGVAVWPGALLHEGDACTCMHMRLRTLVWEIGEGSAAASRCEWRPGVPVRGEEGAAGQQQRRLAHAAARDAV